MEHKAERQRDRIHPRTKHYADRRPYALCTVVAKADADADAGVDAKADAGADAGADTGAGADAGADTGAADDAADDAVTGRGMMRANCPGYKQTDREIGRERIHVELSEL